MHIYFCVIWSEHYWTHVNVNHFTHPTTKTTNKKPKRSKNFKAQRSNNKNEMSSMLSRAVKLKQRTLKRRKNIKIKSKMK